MENVRRIYVEKKNGFDVEAKGVLADLKENLSLKGLKDGTFPGVQGRLHPRIHRCAAIGARWCC